MCKNVCNAQQTPYVYVFITELEQQLVTKNRQLNRLIGSRQRITIIIRQTGKNFSTTADVTHSMYVCMQ